MKSVKSLSIFTPLFLSIAVIFIACGGGGGGGGGGTAPVIDDAVLTDEYYNPTSVFNIGDIANVVIVATDPDLDMENLLVTQYHPDNSSTPYYGPDVAMLPSQSAPTMIYTFIGGVTIVGPAGTWRIEFQIEDYAGHTSSVFRVFSVVL